MFECVPLSKINLNSFEKLNKIRYEFNILNKDFFEVYNKYNFAQQILLRRKVKLLKNNQDYIGYIWFEINDKNIYCINSMNISNTFNNIKDYSSAYEYLINSLKLNCNVNYLCEKNNFNFKVLTHLGFTVKEGTLILYCSLKKDIPLIVKDNLEFQVLQKGKDEEKRCEIQNEIFKNDNRIPLILDDIYFDEIQNYYFDKGAVFLKKDGQYIGYGQIILEDDIPIIVNFGILREYRGNGYSKVFLCYLLKLIKLNEFNVVKIKVKNTNEIALNLYKSLGFKITNELYNWQLKR
jgi:ribosomal protein S18 acetylase RimI-like enzyme